MRSFQFARLLLIAFLVLITAGVSSAQIGIAISFGPPPLPIYAQPPCPEEGYIWVPGYWAYGYDYNDYYWVPGTWVLAPEPGYLWTPGYWAWRGDGFFFNEGYWGPRVGFYGGINYGFGYFGEGYEGGRWEGGRFFYNRAVNNVNITNIHNVYNTTVINNTTVNRISYNGGEGGITARPTPQDEIAARDRRLPPVAAQTEHVQAARGNPQFRASVNRGKPPVAATPRPGAFSEHGAVAAKQAGGPYRPAPGHPNNEPRGGGASRPDVPRPPAHAADVQPHERPAPPNTGNAKQDQRYQQEQDKLYARQQQDHQKLQQQQERDHQRMQQEQARQPNEARQQQMEQRHQQQTQQMEQRHVEQQQHIQQRQQPPPNRGEPRPH